MTLDRTMFAMEAFTFADRFHTCFVGRQVEGYKLFLTAPESESTGGGIQAVQHITLQDEVHNRAIVLGSAHGLGKKVQLRSYGSIVHVFTQRFPGVAFPVSLAEYDDLQQSFIKFFEMLKFEVDIEAAQVDAKRPIEEPSKSESESEPAFAPSRCSVCSRSVPSAKGASVFFSSRVSLGYPDVGLYPQRISAVSSCQLRHLLNR